jgi:hypothetical protein
MVRIVDGHQSQFRCVTTADSLLGGYLSNIPVAVWGADRDVPLDLGAICCDEDVPTGEDGLADG